MKFVPVIVSVKAAPPATATLGLNVTIVGAASGVATAGAVKANPAEDEPTKVEVSVSEVRFDPPPEVEFAAPSEDAEDPPCAALADALWLEGAVAAGVNAFVCAASRATAVRTSAPAACLTMLALRNQAPPNKSTSPAGNSIVKTSGEERSLSLRTVTLALPSAAIRPAGTTAVTRSALTKPVASSLVSHTTVVAGVKFSPSTVRVNSAPPATAAAGLRAVIAGAAPYTAGVPASASAAAKTVNNQGNFSPSLRIASHIQCGFRPSLAAAQPALPSLDPGDAASQQVGAILFFSAWIRNRQLSRAPKDYFCQIM